LGRSGRIAAHGSDGLARADRRGGSPVLIVALRERARGNDFVVDQLKLILGVRTGRPSGDFI
jgi:hypothetical protein